MTELIYFEDCYKKEFDATVKEVDGKEVVLDKTAFYPEGGGQPSDTGTLDGFRVKKAQKAGDKVKHILPNHSLEEGEEVYGEIDWEKRYSYMKYHTAQHILSSLVLDEFGGKTTGNQLYKDRARIDFDVDISDEVKEIEKLVNEVIEEGRDVSIYTMSREKAVEELDPERTRINLLPDSVTELRIIEIEDLDRTACAGTHVSKTDELGEFKVTDTESKGKGRKRIEFVLD